MTLTALWLFVGCVFVVIDGFAINLVWLSSMHLNLCDTVFLDSTSTVSFRIDCWCVSENLCSAVGLIVKADAHELFSLETLSPSAVKWLEGDLKIKKHQTKILTFWAVHCSPVQGYWDLRKFCLRVNSFVICCSLFGVCGSHFAVLGVTLASFGSLGMSEGPFGARWAPKGSSGWPYAKNVRPIP